MVETAPTATIPESPRARQLEEESTATAGEIGYDERAALAIDGSAIVPEAMVGTTRSSRAEAKVAGNV